MKVGANHHTGVCMKLQDIYDQLNTIENNALTFRTLFDDPEFINQVSSSSIRKSYSRVQRTQLVKKVYQSSSLSKEKQQSMVWKLSQKDALSPFAAEFIKDSVNKNDDSKKEYVENVIAWGGPYYFNKFDATEEI